MSRRRVRLVVVCEDRNHRSFLLGLLVDAMGFRPEKIRFEVAPGGRGAGEQWVRRRYPVEVAEVRRLGEKIGIVVMIDADRGTVEDHHRELERALESTGQPPRSPEERISLQVPRHVETWVRHIEGEVVDEDADCSDPGGRRCRAAGALIRQACRDDPRIRSLPSLARGCAELDRLADG